MGKKEMKREESAAKENEGEVNAGKGRGLCVHVLQAATCLRASAARRINGAMSLESNFSDNGAQLMLTEIEGGEVPRNSVLEE